MSPSKTQFWQSLFCICGLSWLDPPRHQHLRNSLTDAMRLHQKVTQINDIFPNFEQILKKPGLRVDFRGDLGYVASYVGFGV